MGGRCQFVCSMKYIFQVFEVMSCCDSQWYDTKLTLSVLLNVSSPEYTGEIGMHLTGIIQFHTT